GAPLPTRLCNFGHRQTLGANVSNPSSTYGTAGSYSPTLTVTTVNGCHGSLTLPNAITVAQPDAEFHTADTNYCLNVPINFINTSTGNGLTSTWDFGDGGSSTLQNPTHTYTAPGIYVVTLYVQDAAGCLDTFVLNPDINIQNIQASFIASDTILGCPPLSVNFTNTSVGQVSNAWFFGNGGQASTLNAASVYTTSGIFLAKLIVTSANGCQDSAFQNIHINGPQGT